MKQSTAFTRFAYQHDDGVNHSPQRIWFVCTSLLGALAIMGLSSPAIGVVWLGIPLIAWLATPRQLLLGPRYLLCGNTIVYFGNVKRMTLLPAHGKLRLECTNGMAFVLERHRFPSRLRLVEKLVKSRAARFDTLSTRIIAHVRAASANVVLISA
jgi:hypothetical protein